MTTPEPSTLREQAKRLRAWSKVGELVLTTAQGEQTRLDAATNLDAYADLLEARAARPSPSVRDIIDLNRQMQEWREKAEHGFRCFHCRFWFFADDGSALEHFGKSSGDTPKCLTEAARPSPWQDKHPTCGDCKFWEWERVRNVGKMVEIAETRDMGHCRCPGSITENERTPTEFYCPLVEPSPPAQDGVSKA